jgi:hypothetical protein
MIGLLLIAAGVIMLLIVARYSPRDEVPADDHRRLMFCHLRQVRRCLFAGEIVFAGEHTVAGWCHGWQWLVDTMRN